MIAKILVAAAIAVGSYLGAAAPVSADPNPFGTLGCDCRQAPAADGPALKAEIDRGLREGHSAWLPGLPAPVQPTQPRS
jgi:hypothetical protein